MIAGSINRRIMVQANLGKKPHSTSKIMKAKIKIHKQKDRKYGSKSVKTRVKTQYCQEQKVKEKWKLRLVHFLFLRQLVIH
jgi:hypothetical protein